MRQALTDIPGAKIEVSVYDMMTMMASGDEINVQIRGDDLEVLKNFQSDRRTDREVPGTRKWSFSD
jgi:hypothetical protein